MNVYFFKKYNKYAKGSHNRNYTPIKNPCVNIPFHMKKICKQGLDEILSDFCGTLLTRHSKLIFRNNCSFE